MQSTAAVALHALWESSAVAGQLPSSLRSIYEKYRDEYVDKLDVPADRRYLKVHEGHTIYVKPGEGRYLVSVIPFDGAVEGTVHLGQITFSLEGHDYLLLTSMPITVSEHVWVKRERDFKPSERMVRASDARDDRPAHGLGRPRAR